MKVERRQLYWACWPSSEDSDYVEVRVHDLSNRNAILSYITITKATLEERRRAGEMLLQLECIKQGVDT